MKSREKILSLRASGAEISVERDSPRRLRQKSQQESADKVLQEVRHHSRAKTLAPCRQNSEQRSIHADSEHEFGALVSVRCAKQHALRDDSDRRYATGGGELLL